MKSIGMAMGMVVLAAGVASAAPLTVAIGAAGVQVTVPSEWKASDSPNGSTIVEPTGNAFINFTLIPGNKQALAQAKATFDAQLGKMMTDLKMVMEMTPKKLNGLDIVISEATGTLKASKKPVKLGIMLVFTPKKKVLLITAMVAAEKEAALKATIVGVLASIAPVTKDATAPTADSSKGANTSAAPTTLPQAAPAAGSGKMAVVYAPPGDDIPVRKAIRQEGQFEILAKNLSSNVKLPRDIPIVFKKCGQVNAFYDPTTVSITMCDEFTEFFINAGKAWKGTNQEKGLRVLHVLEFFFLHEFGHAVIDQLHIPAVGREEDAADQIAAVMLIANSQAGEDIARDGAVGFLSVMELHKGAPPAFADEHSLDEQRFYNIACLLYGSNPAKYSGMVDSKVLPKARAARCPTEWSKVSGAWQTLLGPYIVKH